MSLHALTAMVGADLLGVALGGLLPWPTGASMIAAGLTAVLSAMALLYHSDRQRLEPVRDLAAFEPLEAHLYPSGIPHEPTAELAPEAGATAP